ncbi:MAG: hypothetical protein JXA89_04760 [Anaerolineae bacterium]|nr:hypothetical protein [Anaerolineae bacterium]
MTSNKKDPPIRPRLYISVMLLMLMLVLFATAQWDWLLAVFLGFLLGNGLSTLWERRS